jgi:hypothetical protein
MLIDLTNPTNPFRLSRYDTGEPPEDVVLAGNYLYAAFAGDAEEGLQVFDVSDPVRPRPIGSYATGFARGLALSGNHLYVAASGLQVIDISNPTRPTRVGWLGRSDMDAHAIAITGHYACVADRSRGLHVIDISDPTQPRHIGRYSKSNLAAVAVSGNLAWASDELIDISDPRNPRRVAGGLSGAALVMVGQLAYVGEAYGRLKVVDIGRLANPQRVGGNAQILSSSDLEIVGEYAYLASYAEGLQVVDLTIPARPVRVGHIDTPGVAYGVAVAGAHAYVADGPAGLQVVDVANPAAPRLLGRLPTAGEARDVAVSGSLACVACGNEGMQVIDVANPHQPRPIARFVSKGGVQHVAVSGNRAIAGNYWLDSGWFEVVDLSEPTNPRSVAGPYSVDSWGFPKWVPIGYSPDAAELWQLSDLTDPAHPRPIGGYRTIASALGLVVSGQYAFRISRDGETPRLQVYDLSDRSQPRLVGQNSAVQWPGSLALANGHLFLATDGEGLTVLEMLPFLKSISVQNGQVQLDWEGWGRARLEGTTSLGAPDWQDLGIPETSNSVSLPLSNPHAFFRLRRP